jgi:hypothetical protein
MSCAPRALIAINAWLMCPGRAGLRKVIAEPVPNVLLDRRTSPDRYMDPLLAYATANLAAPNERRRQGHGRGPRMNSTDIPASNALVNVCNRLHNPLDNRIALLGLAGSCITGDSGVILWRSRRGATGYYRTIT